MEILIEGINDALVWILIIAVSELNQQFKFEKEGTASYRNELELEKLLGVICRISFNRESLLGISHLPSDPSFTSLKEFGINRIQ